MARSGTWRAASAVAVFAAALAAGACDNGNGSGTSAGGGAAGDQPAVGSYVVVQVRRDYLGATGAAIGPQGEGAPAGTPVAVGGELRKLSADWVVVESGGQEIWIPRGAVLLVAVQKK